MCVDSKNVKLKTEWTQKMGECMDSKKGEIFRKTHK